MIVTVLSPTFSIERQHVLPESCIDLTFARRLADLPAGASDIIALADGSYVLSQHREVLAHAGPGPLREALSAVRPFGSIAAVKETISSATSTAAAAALKPPRRSYIATPWRPSRRRAG